MAILWLRRFIRRHTKPIPEGTAHIWKQRLSFGYVFLAWNAFGFVVYMMYTGKHDWAAYHGLKSKEELEMTPAQYWTKTLGIRNAVVYNVNGFNVNRYEVHNPEIKSNGFFNWSADDKSSSDIESTDSTNDISSTSEK